MPERPGAVIVSALRTPVGRYGGILRDIRPDDLGAAVNDGASGALITNEARARSVGVSPPGCSGTRILTTLLNSMSRRRVKWGLATMCIGVGQGISVIVENQSGL